MKKLYMFMAAMLLLATTAMAQNNADPKEWQLLQETSGVKVYYLKGTCFGQNAAFLKIENTLDHAVSVVVKPGEMNGLTVISNTEPEPIHVAAKSSVEGDCSTSKPMSLNVILNGADKPAVSVEVSEK